MEINQCILTQNDCYQAGRTITPRGVMVHSTGANNTRISRYVGPDDGKLGVNRYNNHWNCPNLPVCVHAFIGTLPDGTVTTYQTLPWNHRAWHCGGAANNTHISFEVCEDDRTDQGYFQASYQESVSLTAHLCTLYNLDPLADGVVICHDEGRSRGVASNHKDVNHWWPQMGKTMDDFRSDVARKMAEPEEETMTQEQFDTMLEDWMSRRGTQPASSWAEPGLATAQERGITDGSRPLAFATRQEVALMLVSATK